MTFLARRHIRDELPAFWASAQADRSESEPNSQPSARRQDFEHQGVVQNRSTQCQHSAQGCEEGAPAPEMPCQMGCASAVQCPKAVMSGNFKAKSGSGEEAC